MIPPGFAGVEAQLWLWLLAMIRPGAAFLAAPIFGARFVPVQLRLLLALALGLVRDGRVSLPAALAYLAAREVNEVLVECGPRLAGGFLHAGLVDELVVYTAAKLLGDTARGLVHLPGLERLADHVALQFTSAEFLGPDLKITARLASKER